MGAGSVRVIENYLGDHYAELEREPHDGLVLGWAAWVDHQADWRELGLHATVSRLLDAHPQLRVESVGMIDLGLPPERYRRSEPVAFEALGQRITALRPGDRADRRQPLQPAPARTSRSRSTPRPACRGSPRR